MINYLLTALKVTPASIQPRCYQPAYERLQYTDNFITAHR